MSSGLEIEIAITIGIDRLTNSISPGHGQHAV